MMKGKPQNPADGRYHSIDFVKGLCIIFVIISHYAWDYTERLKLLFPFWIDMAVPIFMVITGYVYTKSFQKHKIITLEQAYTVDSLLGRIIRYSVPFIIVFCLEEIVFNATGIVHHGFVEIIRDFLVGGLGSGTYYFPLMIQLIFYFPIIYVIIRKYDFNGLILCGFINFMYELLKRAYNMNLDCYRLLIFRYTLVIAYGCYYAMRDHKRNKKLSIICFCVGVCYIIITKYANVYPPLTIYWTGTSMWACLYIIPFIGPAIINGISNRFIELLGKASFDIFLAQMVYYVEAIINPIYNSVQYRALELLINLAICITGGLILYFIETPITKKVNEMAYNLWGEYKNKKHL